MRVTSLTDLQTYMSKHGKNHPDFAKLFKILIELNDVEPRPAQWSRSKHIEITQKMLFTSFIFPGSVIGRVLDIHSPDVQEVLSITSGVEILDEFFSALEAWQNYDDYAPRKCYKVMHSGVVVGNALTINDELDNLIILPQHQRKGYGTLVMNFYAHQRKARGLKFQFVTAIRDSFKFHLKNGFLPIGCMKRKNNNFETFLVRKIYNFEYEGIDIVYDQVATEDVEKASRVHKAKNTKS